MASVIDICNLALNEIGEESIMDLLENSKQSRLCNQFYDLSRDMLLRAHPWNFATKRVELAMLTETPVFDYSYAFQLPTDCLKIQQTDDRYDHYKVEGRKVLSNNSSVKILYTARITDTEQFDSLFVETLSLMLASRISFNLSDNNALSQSLYAKYEAALRRAKAMDGQEGVMDTIIADQWLQSRY